ncbi:MAG TPA: hypothetical protein VHF06_33190 [Pseudonocardiaceae bacterium]|jgi:hypothetical protein|nr:hypothetical protein [Pseudonocardiaceae bacterium]
MTRSVPFLVLAALLLTACGTAPTAAPTATPAHRPPRTTTSARPDPMVGWAAEFCHLDSEVSTEMPMAPLPEVGAGTSRADLLDYLAESKSLLTGAKSAFGKLDPAPTVDATAMVRSYLKNVDDSLGSVADATSTIEHAPAKDLDVETTYAEGVMTLFQAQALDVVSKAIKAHPDLKAALTGVAGCEVYGH